MDIPSIIVLIVVAVCLTGAVVYLVRNRGKGCGGCSGCGGCAGCAGCARQGKKERKSREKPGDPPSACLKGAESVDNNGKDGGAEGGRTE